MSEDWLERLYRERNELFDFAVEAVHWIAQPTDAKRHNLIQRARVLADASECPSIFDEFAHWLTKQHQADGSEPR